MNKRKLFFIVTGGAVILLVLWIARPFEDHNGDETKCKEWERSAVMIARVQRAENRLPSVFVRLLHLSKLREKYEQQHEGLEDALLASSYFTNVTIAVTNYMSNRAQFYDRVRKKLGTGDGWEYGIGSNQITLTCRPGFVPRARQVFGEIDKSFETRRSDLP